MLSESSRDFRPTRGTVDDEQARVKSLLLADRHHDLIEGIRGLLQTKFDAVIMVSDGISLLEAAERLQPTLGVVELSLSQNDSLALLRTVRARCPELKMVVVSMYDEPSVARSVLEAGANAYVVKSRIAGDLIPAVDAVLAGYSFVSHSVSLAGFNCAKTATTS